MNYLLGVDIGTQGTKCVLIDTEGKVLAQGYKSYEVETPKPSWAEQWPNVWEEATYKTIEEVIKKTDIPKDKIKGLGISSLYGGSGVPVNNNLDPIYPCLIWMDRRAEREVDWIKENIDMNELYQVTGNGVNSYFGFPKMLWIKNNKPDIWKQIKYFVPPAPYIVYKLTDKLAVDYSSAGNIGGIFDLKKRKWADNMIESLGISPSMFPEKLVNSTEIIGGVSEKAAEITGLRAGTPVVSGGIDAAVATLGAGALSEGNHVAMLGTSMCWGFITEKTNISQELVSMPHAVEADTKNYTFGGAATAGVLMKWFKNVMGEAEKQAEHLTGLNAYAMFDMQSEDVPAGANGLLVLPYFMGERSPIWDSNARGVIFGLSLTHKKEDIYKALMEGVAFSLKHNMEMVKGTSMKLDDEIIIVGGGAKSKIWPQIYADITGHPVKIVENDVEATLGDALLAGLATGEIDDYNTITNWLNFKETIYPNKKNTDFYDELYKEYKTLYINTKESMEAVAKLSR
jgi:ribulokinase